MTYLAYDPTRLAALAQAMRGALDELDTIRSDDALAGDAVRQVGHARLHLGQLWVPLVDSITGSDPLGDLLRPPVYLSTDDLTDQLMQLMHDRYGWQVVVPTGLFLGMPTGAVPSTPPTPQEVVALADILEDGNLTELVDTPEERAELSAELTLIAADPELAELFDAAFDRWDELGDELGHVRIGLNAESDDGVGEGVGDVDMAFRAIAAIATSVHGNGSIPQLVETMEPYAAAVVISQCDLEPEMLACLSVETLQRLESRRPHLWWEDMRPGPKTGDILFTKILATQGAPTAFVIAVRHEPELLWWTAADATLAQRVAAVGTDPANITTAEAHIVIHSFVEWFESYDRLSRDELRYTAPPWKSSRGFLGALAAPWFVEFAGGTRDWGPDYASRRADLDFIMKDPAARDALFQRMHDEAATLVADPLRHYEDEAIVAAIGLLVELEVERKIREGKDAKAAWDGGWSVVIEVISYSGQLFGPEGAAITKAAAQALSETKRVLDANGWLGAPPPVGDVATRARIEQDRVKLTMAAIAVNAGFENLHGDPGLKPGAVPPPMPTPGNDDDVLAYWWRYQDWRDANVVEGSQAESTIDAQWHMFFSDIDIGERRPG